jgi:hypothetical protein
MVLLTFSECEDRLLNKSKTSTIRKNIEYWDKFFDIPNGYTLHVHWQNPRTRHPDHYFMGLAEPFGSVEEYGRNFTLETAQDDGFDSLEELLNTLARMHKMTLGEVFSMKWIIGYFSWLNGYPMKGGKS